MKTFKTMLKTELKLSLRGMDMFIFAICVPLAVLAVMGIIYGDRPAFGGAGETQIVDAEARIRRCRILISGTVVRSRHHHIHLCRRCDGIAAGCL